MTKKTRPSLPSDDEVQIPQFHPEALRNMLEGTWQVMLPPELPELGDLTDFEEYEIYITQDDDDPYRFTGLYETEFAEGTLDLRVLPFAGTDESTAPIFFTYNEEDDLEEYYGGGFISPIDEDAMVGLKMEHMSENMPIMWRRISRDVPDEVRELQELPNAADVISFRDAVREMFLPNKPETIEELFDYRGPAKKLIGAGITTIPQLMEATDEQLLAIRGIGPSTLAEIREKLAHFGLSEVPSYELKEDLLLHVFTLRVSLEGGKTVWREFELLGEHTLHDLHVMIQVGFDWDDDHLYSFFMSGSYWDDASAISHPFAGDELDATEIQLAALSLEKGKKFVYIFDYGDEWRHVIEVRSISDAPIATKTRDDYPRLTKSKGEAPEQYPDWDEDEDELFD